jgi:hypothetical protein
LAVPACADPKKPGNDPVKVPAKVTIPDLKLGKRGDAKPQDKIKVNSITSSPGVRRP